MSLEEERARQHGPAGAGSSATPASNANANTNANASAAPEEEDPLLAQAIALSLAADGVSWLEGFLLFFVCYSLKVENNTVPDQSTQGDINMDAGANDAMEVSAPKQVSFFLSKRIVFEIMKPDFISRCQTACTSLFQS